MNALRHNMEGTDGGVYHSEGTQLRVVKDESPSYGSVMRELEFVKTSLNELRMKIKHSRMAMTILDEAIDRSQNALIDATDDYNDRA